MNLVSSILTSEFIVLTTTTTTNRTTTGRMEEHCFHVCKGRTLILFFLRLKCGVLREVEGFSNQIIDHTVHNGLTMQRLLIIFGKKTLAWIELHSASFDLFICPPLFPSLVSERDSFVRGRLLSVFSKRALYFFSVESLYFFSFPTSLPPLSSWLRFPPFPIWISLLLALSISLAPSPPLNHPT